jgi:hypothetical protein
MKGCCVLALLAASGSSAAEIALPDTCDDQVCVTGLLWKKGTVEHTLTGFVAPRLDHVDSIEIVFAYSDPKHQGKLRVHLKDVQSRTSFYFKLFGGALLQKGRFDWNQSNVTVEATSITRIAAQESAGIKYSFRSLGSRLKAVISNTTDKDAVLEYGLLSLIARGEGIRLNGSHGKYADLGTPNPSTLIPASASITEEFIPFGSASFVDGKWVEDWRMHEALATGDASLALPLAVDGRQHIERIPIQVIVGRVVARGQVTKP